MARKGWRVVDSKEKTHNSKKDSINPPVATKTRASQSTKCVKTKCLSSFNWYFQLSKPFGVFFKNDSIYSMVNSHHFFNLNFSPLNCNFQTSSPLASSVSMDHLDVATYRHGENVKKLKASGENAINVEVFLRLKRLISGHPQFPILFGVERYAMNMSRTMSQNKPCN